MTIPVFHSPTLHLSTDCQPPLEIICLLTVRLVCSCVRTFPVTLLPIHQAAKHYIQTTQSPLRSVGRGQSYLFSKNKVKNKWQKVQVNINMTIKFQSNAIPVRTTVMARHNIIQSCSSIMIKELAQHGCTMIRRTHWHCAMIIMIRAEYDGYVSVPPARVSARKTCPTNTNSCSMAENDGGL